MLVLSRRANEKLSFPEVGVTIHFLRVQSGTVKVGVDAPPQIQIIRDEERPNEGERADQNRKALFRLPREVRHTLRNELHTISVGVHLFHEQMQLGMQEEAQETFEYIQQSLKGLDENELLRSCESSPMPEHSRIAKVLIVEDEENEREMLAGLLRLKGYEVFTANDGEEALTFLEWHPAPQIILLDMKMPRRDGASTLMEIRKNDCLKTSRVFGISGTTPEENGIEMGPCGIDRWFPKPLDVVSLVAAVLGEEALLSN